MVRAQDPVVVFIAETWLDKTRLIGLHGKIGFGGKFGVSHITQGRGLAFFWKRDFDLHVEDSSPNVISIINKGKEDAWRFTGF